MTMTPLPTAHTADAAIDLIDVAALPLTERMLLAAEVMTGGNTEFLSTTLRLMANAYRRAALVTRDRVLLAHLDGNARECRQLALLADLANQTATFLGASLGAGALAVVQSLDEAGTDHTTFGPDSRAEMAAFRTRAMALVHYLADVAARAATS